MTARELHAAHVASVARMDEAAIEWLEQRASGRDTQDSDGRWKSADQERRRLERRIRRRERSGLPV